MNNYIELEIKPMVNKTTGRVEWVATYKDDNGNTQVYNGSLKKDSQVFEPKKEN